MIFTTKFAIVLREDLETWQKLNVTAFLTSGIIGANPNLIGAPYEDAAGGIYHALLIQPAIVLSAPAERMQEIFRRARERPLRFSLYIDDMFSTSHDDANRDAVRQRNPDDMRIAGVGLHGERNVIDKITKGARLHP
jgi:hypothetical protein